MFQHASHVRLMRAARAWGTTQKEEKAEATAQEAFLGLR